MNNVNQHTRPIVEEAIENTKVMIADREKMIQFDKDQIAHWMKMLAQDKALLEERKRWLKEWQAKQKASEPGNDDSSYFQEFDEFSDADPGL
jgi:hypothetical protein